MKNNHDDKKKTVMVGYRVSPEFANKLKARAMQKNVSMTKYIESLVDKDIASDISDESLFVYHINELRKIQEKILRTTETFATIFNNFLVLYFAYYPEEADNKIWFDLKQKGIKRYDNFIEGIKKNMMNNSMSYLEGIFGSLLEEDDIFDKYKPIKNKSDEEQDKSK